MRNEPLSEEPFVIAVIDLRWQPIQKPKLGKAVDVFRFLKEASLSWDKENSRT